MARDFFKKASVRVVIKTTTTEKINLGYKTVVKDYSNRFYKEVFLSHAINGFTSINHYPILPDKSI